MELRRACRTGRWLGLYISFFEVRTAKDTLLWFLEPCWFTPKYIHVREAGYTGVALGLFMVLMAVRYDTEVWPLDTSDPAERDVSSS